MSSGLWIAIDGLPMRRGGFAVDALQQQLVDLPQQVRVRLAELHGQQLADIGQHAKPNDLPQLAFVERHVQFRRRLVVFADALQHEQRVADLLFGRNAMLAQQVGCTG